MRGGPAALVRDARGETNLPIQRRKHRLDIRHDGLHLDQEEHPSCRVPRENIKRASLASDHERDLSGDVPAYGSKPAHHHVHEPCMRRIEHPIHRFAIPAEPEIQACSEGVGDSV